MSRSCGDDAATTFPWQRVVSIAAEVVGAVTSILELGGFKRKQTLENTFALVYRHCNPGPIFLNTGFGIGEFVIPGSRDPDVIIDWQSVCMHGCPQKFLQGGQSPILHSLYHPSLIPFASPPSFHSLPYLVFPPCTPPPRREAAPSNLAVVTGGVCRLLIGIGGGAPTANVFRYILSPWNLLRGNDLGFSASQRVVIEATVVCTFSGFWQMSMSISPVEIIILTLQRTVMNVFL